MKQKFASVVCAGCTCLCDDLNVTIRDEQISVSPDCRVAAHWFDLLCVEPHCKIEGEQVEFNDAIARAVELVSTARNPLVCGLDGLSTQSQIIAFEIAKRIHARIDTTFTNRGRERSLAMQRIGQVTATLGEVAMRSDLVVFWFCDPVETHPRFIERFCKSADKIIVVAESANATSKQASQFIQLSRDQIGSFLTNLRLCIAGNDESCDIAKALADTLVAASYGAFVAGSLDTNAAVNQNTQSMAELIRDLNQQTRFVSLGFRSDGNAQSAENVMAWSSGYPSAIDLLGETPLYNGLEFSSVNILERGECDVALICSATSLDELSPSARKHLSRIPRIVITDESDSRDIEPTVQFNISFDEGDWCRLDDVLFPVVNILKSADAKPRTAREVLMAIRDSLT